MATVNVTGWTFDDTVKRGLARGEIEASESPPARAEAV
jgi:hypothetical protein